MSAFDYKVSDEIDWTSFDKNLVIEKAQLKRSTVVYGEWELKLKFDDETYIFMVLVTDDNRDPKKMDYGKCEWLQGCFSEHGTCERGYCGIHNPLQLIKWEADLGKLVGKKLVSIDDYDAQDHGCEFFINLEGEEHVGVVFKNRFTNKYHNSERYGYNLRVYTFPN